jgi:outer membrane protein OmpA-like peptidoglycan-associated protein
MTSTTVQTHPNVLSTTAIIGDSVVNRTGENLGKIEELMLDLEKGRVAYAVLSFGGFMGLGEKLFAIPFEALKLDASREHFTLDVDKDTIKRSSMAKLDKAVGVLKSHEDIKIEIGGHTDSTGSREYNLDLSRRRARAVKDYLVGKGISDKRITTRGYGPDKPIADNETKDGRARNRRIEFVIDK